MKKFCILFCGMVCILILFTACVGKKETGIADKVQSTETGIQNETEEIAGNQKSIREDYKFDDFVIEVVSVEAEEFSKTARIVFKIQENYTCPADLQRIENIWFDIAGNHSIEKCDAYCLVTETGTYQDRSILTELGVTNMNDGKFDRYTCDMQENQIKIIAGQQYVLERNGVPLTISLTPFSATLIASDTAWCGERESVAFASDLEDGTTKYLFTVPSQKKMDESEKEKILELEEALEPLEEGLGEWASINPDWKKAVFLTNGTMDIAQVKEVFCLN